MRKSKAYSRTFISGKARAIVVSNNNAYSLYYHLEDCELILGHQIEADLQMSIDNEPYVELGDLTRILSEDSQYEPFITNWETREKTINVRGIDINAEISRDNLILVPVAEASRFVNLDSVDLSEIIFSDCGSHTYLMFDYFKILLRSKPTELARKQMRAYRKGKQKSFATL